LSANKNIAGNNIRGIVNNGCLCYNYCIYDKFWRESLKDLSFKPELCLSAELNRRKDATPEK